MFAHMNLIPLITISEDYLPEEHRAFRSPGTDQEAQPLSSATTETVLLPACGLVWCIHSLHKSVRHSGNCISPNRQYHNDVPSSHEHEVHSNVCSMSNTAKVFWEN